MSPKNKIKLNLLRDQLDRLDNKLLLLIKKRSLIVKKVLNLKKYKSEIVDKKLHQNEGEHLSDHEKKTFKKGGHRTPFYQKRGAQNISQNTTRTPTKTRHKRGWDEQEAPDGLD